MPRIDVGPGLPTLPFTEPLRNGIRQNALTHEYNRPWTGNNGTSQNNMYRIGRITAPALAGSTFINRFFFHYNVQSVTLSTQVDPNVRAAQDMAEAKTFSDVTATENCGFDILLNRIPDVAFQQNFAQTAAKIYGTLYDLYYLFGVINANFEDTTIKDNEYPWTDTGILQPNPVTVIFGELFRFVGVVTQLNVTHAKFVASPIGDQTAAPLIPVLTTVSIGLKRTPGAFTDSPGAGGAPATTVNPLLPGVPSTTPPAPGGGVTLVPGLPGSPVLGGTSNSAPSPAPSANPNNGGLGIFGFPGNG